VLAAIDRLVGWQTATIVDTALHASDPTVLVSTTSVYLQGINTEEIISAIHARRAPMMHVSGGLEL
jgi:hypothetical protein